MSPLRVFWQGIIDRAESRGFPRLGAVLFLAALALAMSELDCADRIDDYRRAYSDGCFGGVAYCTPQYSF
jgi:hypothetical protein